MRTPEETLKELETNYEWVESMERYYIPLRDKEEELRHHKKAKEYDDLLNMYQVRKLELSKIYAFILGVEWEDGIKALRAAIAKK